MENIMYAFIDTVAWITLNYIIWACSLPLILTALVFRSEGSTPVDIANVISLFMFIGVGAHFSEITEKDPTSILPIIIILLITAGVSRGYGKWMEVSEHKMLAIVIPEAMVWVSLSVFITTVMYGSYSGDVRAELIRLWTEHHGFAFFVTIVKTLWRGLSNPLILVPVALGILFFLRKAIRNE